MTSFLVRALRSVLGGIPAEIGISDRLHAHRVPLVVHRAEHFTRCGLEHDRKSDVVCDGKHHETSEQNVDDTHKSPISERTDYLYYIILIPTLSSESPTLRWGLIVLYFAPFFLTLAIKLRKETSFRLSDRFRDLRSFVHSNIC